MTFHATQQPALLVMHTSEPFGQAQVVPREVGPCLELVDVVLHSPQTMRRL